MRLIERLANGGSPKNFRKSRSGAVALIFGLAIIPVVMGAGAAVDYARAHGIRAKAQKALDAASLAGATTAAARLRAGAAISAATLAGDNAAKMTFNANVVTWGGVSVESFAPNGAVTATSANYSPTATVNVPTSIMKMAGVTTIPVTVTATAKSSNGTQYTDVYVLVDASQSMGMGASAIDQSNMSADPQIGCEFACHNNHGGDPANFDGVAHARAMGYKLRFDVIRDALTAIVNQAETTMSATGGTIRFGIYTFATNFRTEINITSNYASIRQAIAAMDIADGSAGTSLKHALDELKLKIGATGDGYSPASPKTFVLVMTDGVGNSVDNKRSSPGGYNWVPSTTFFPPYTGTTTCWSQLPPGDGTPTPAPADTPRAPPCVPNPHVPPSWTGNYEMELIGVDPAWCAPVKAMGATLMTLYTTYLVHHSDYDWRSAYLRRRLLPEIPDQMRACASSPADYFVANDAAQVTAAIDQMFKRVTMVRAAKLTR